MAKETLAEVKGSFHELWSETWPILAATAAMAAVVLLLREFVFSSRPEPAWIKLVALSITGTATYAAALFAIGSPVIGEGAEVAGWIMRRRSADS